MYMYTYTCLCVCMFICTHTLTNLFIFWSSGSGKSTAWWVGYPRGLMGPSSSLEPRWAWVCSPCLRHSSLRGFFLDVRILFLPSMCCGFSSPWLKLVLLSAHGPWPSRLQLSWASPSPGVFSTVSHVNHLHFHLSPPIWFLLSFSYASVIFVNLSLKGQSRLSALKLRTPGRRLLGTQFHRSGLKGSHFHVETSKVQDQRVESLDDPRASF